MKKVLKALLCVVALTGSTLNAQGQEIKKLKTFYFGNSFLENSMVGFHPILGKTAGKTWEVNALIHPGVPIWVHAVRQTEPESGNYKSFHKEGPAVDAIVMLQFAGMGLKYTTDEMWQGKFKFDPRRDVGDIASCITIIREYLKMNPKGRAYVYTAWPREYPEMREFNERVQEEALRSAQYANLPREEVMKRVKKEVRITDDQMEPFLEAGDFEAAWLAQDYLPEVPEDLRARYTAYAGCMRLNQRDKSWKPTLEELAEAAKVSVDRVKEDLAFNKVNIEQLRAAKSPTDLLVQVTGRGGGEWYRSHSRPHNYALQEALKKEFPEMWAGNRLGMIPVGDVMLAFHKKIRAGKVPGLKGVGQLAPGHMRSGLGRYMLGATFYAVLFRDHPKNLDAAIYAGRNNYINTKHPGYPKLNMIGGFYVHEPDLGRHIEITPERKKLMDETIWEVVQGHPYTGVK